MRIHVTEHTKQLLDELGGYILEPRGSLEIKVTFRIKLKFLIELGSLTKLTLLQGKGVMSTYWLLDKEGGLPRREVELSIPGFFKPEKNASQPEFIHEIFGSSGSEDNEEPVRIQISKTPQPSILSHGGASSTNNSASRIPMGVMKKS
jgi:hypothetical protein